MGDFISMFPYAGIPYYKLYANEGVIPGASSNTINDRIQSAGVPRSGSDIWGADRALNGMSESGQWNPSIYNMISTPGQSGTLASLAAMQSIDPIAFNASPLGKLPAKTLGITDFSKYIIGGKSPTGIFDPSKLSAAVLNQYPGTEGA